MNKTTALLSSLALALLLASCAHEQMTPPTTEEETPPMETTENEPVAQETPEKKWDVLLLAKQTKDVAESIVGIADKTEGNVSHYQNETIQLAFVDNHVEKITLKPTDYKFQSDFERIFTECGLTFKEYENMTKKEAIWKEVDGFYEVRMTQNEKDGSILAITFITEEQYVDL